MTATTIFTSILWGALSGVLGIQILTNLLALLFCAHGLFQTRWKRLSNKAKAGQVKYGTILQLMLRIGLYTLLFVMLLSFGDSYVRREFWFEYRGDAALLFTAVATLATLGFLPAIRRRLQMVWRMSHEFDYAERRKRTRMLKR